MESSSSPAREEPSFSTAADDDATIARLLANPTEDGINLDLSQSFEMGEKADDAKDFEDISDDDLPNEEFPETAAVAPTTEQEPGYEDDPDIDGLFDDGGSSPVAEKAHADGGRMSHTDLEQLKIPKSGQSGVLAETSGVASQAQDAPSDGDLDSMDDDDDPEWLEQKRLFAEASMGGGALPAPPEDEGELLQSLLPRFDPSEPARFQRLLGPMPMQYAWKKPIKAPKAMNLSKLNLELRQDQEKSFKLAASTATGRAYPDWSERDGMITVGHDQETTEEDDNQVVRLDEFDGNELVGGLSIQDLAVLCADWDINSTTSATSTPPDMTEASPEADENVTSATVTLQKRTSPTSEDADDVDAAAVRKRLKTAQKPFDGYLPMNYDSFYSFDDPELTNSLLARHVQLDLNDPHMLIDLQNPDITAYKPKRAGQDFRKEVSGSLTKSMTRKYNISNDDAYELLKENHSSKIRSMIGNLTPEHSMPAMKLQFPFYRVKLSARDARTYHRAPLRVHNETNRIIKPAKRDSRKRKDLKIMTVQQIFETAKDLSVNDNSDIIMMEYSEEQPMVLSDFGMGNKLINYYRRSDEHDMSRPKFDLGDTSVLLPQDKSPFSVFGNVAPGANQPTLHNAMFRAPVWQHSERPTDFILGRSTTGVGGNVWFLRKTSNTFVVGQQFPSVEVPGTHSRKVTDAAKRRLKQISFRVYHKFSMNPRKFPALTNDVVREHLPGSDVPQNRGKMREFMAYDKAYSMWVPQAGDIIPDTYAGIRERPDCHIRPEDVALLDAMQVGHQYLKDRGLDKDDSVDDDKEADYNEEETEDQLEVKLAPWHATKNFLKACQGQAMLRLHGKGDPTGRQEGYDMVKISMKGGFKAFGESIADTLARQKQNQKSGHSYNVADQQKIYEASIQRIWQAQMASLSADAEHSDVEPDVDDEMSTVNYNAAGQTPRSGLGTPAASRRGPLDSASQMSRGSSQVYSGRPLRVIRKGKDKYGRETVTEHLVKDPRVMKLYLQHANRRKRANISLDSAAPTGDASNDALQQQA